MISNILSGASKLLYCSLLSFKAIKHHLDIAIPFYLFVLIFITQPMFEGMLCIPLGMCLQPGGNVFCSSDGRITR